MRCMFSWSSIIRSRCTKVELLERVRQIVGTKFDGIELSGKIGEDINTTILDWCPLGCIFHNSFMPITCFDVVEEKKETVVKVTFVVKRKVQLFICFYNLILLLLELGMLILCLMQLLYNPILLIMPVVMGTFAVGVCYCGLVFSSKMVSNILLRLWDKQGEQEDGLRKT